MSQGIKYHIIHRGTTNILIVLHIQNIIWKELHQTHKTIS